MAEHSELSVVLTKKKGLSQRKDESLGKIDTHRSCRDTMKDHVEEPYHLHY